MSVFIQSAQNTRIKNLKKLEKSSERKEQGVFLIEGLRELCLAVRAGYELEELFLCEELLTQSEEYNLSEVSENTPIILLSKEAYSAVAYRETTEGILATAKPKEHGLQNLELKENALVLVIEAVEKPGNLGAMLRTCDAAAVDAVIVCDARTDVYNPNVVRSSIGCIFTNQIGVGTTEEVIHFLKEKKVKTYAAELTAEKFYFEQDLKEATAIVVGTEATGLSEEWIHAAEERIKIPMLGTIDSLNVSVSAAVLLFEARRQRAINS
jgi:TrmH family RNA methyltransferase